MNKIKIAVTGANGQLGQNLKRWYQSQKSQQEWHFFSSAELDITKKDQLKKNFNVHSKFDYIINCAAYTKVDQAESEIESAEKINGLAVKELARVCEQSDIILIHISTDFVFEGNIARPLTETDCTNPINVYGRSKLLGEKELKTQLEKHFILRTGWLYSDLGKNFFTTIQKLAREKEELKVVFDQAGTPTHVSVLIQAILKIIETRSTAFGTYHIANEGLASWYDFAYEILQFSKISTSLIPVLSSEFLTPAKRPHFSVLDKSKFKKEFKVEIPHWKESLKTCF